MRLSSRISGLYNNHYVKQIKTVRFPMAENTSKVFFNQRIDKQSLSFVGSDYSGFGKPDRHYSDFSNYPVWFQCHYITDNNKCKPIDWNFDLIDITGSNKERIKAPTPPLTDAELMAILASLAGETNGS